MGDVEIYLGNILEKLELKNYDNYKAVGVEFKSFAYCPKFFLFFSGYTKDKKLALIATRDLHKAWCNNNFQRTLPVVLASM